MCRKFSILIVIVTLPALAEASDREVVPEKIPAVAIFLLDEKAVFGYGHAALLVGDEEGWDYYSFGPHSGNGTDKNTLFHVHYSGSATAMAAQELQRYTKYLSWSTNDSNRTKAIRQRVLKDWANSDYDLINRNCSHMVGDAIKSGEFSIDISAVPVSAYEANKTKANSYGPRPVEAR